jgi:hypothetical protein
VFDSDPARPGRRSRTKRGRPLKFGRRGQVVAVTLPQEVVRGLRRLDPDLAWAIVRLFDKTAESRRLPRKARADAELVSVTDRRSLIVVNRKVFHRLPGVSIIPLHGDRALLTLESGRDMSDLELMVIDRLNTNSLESRERRALQQLHARLRRWRRDRRLRCEMRSIVVLERLDGLRPRS